MKIRVLSDLHVEGCVFKYERLDEDVIVLAGDIGVGYKTIDYISLNYPKDIPIIFVAGNHEYYRHNVESVNEYFKKYSEGTNIHFLLNEEVIINNVRFLGGTMWSNFGLFGEGERWFVEQASARNISDFHLIKTGFTNRAWATSDCFKAHQDFEKWLKMMLHVPFQGDTVIVTHFCPSEKSVAERYKMDRITPFFTSNMEHLMGFSKLWIHGHTHDSYDYDVAGTRIVCNPRGYGAENKGGFNQNLIVEI